MAYWWLECVYIPSFIRTNSHLIFVNRATTYICISIMSIHLLILNRRLCERMESVSIPCQRECRLRIPVMYGPCGVLWCVPHTSHDSESIRRKNVPTNFHCWRGPYSVCVRTLNTSYRFCHIQIYDFPFNENPFR